MTLFQEKILNQLVQSGALTSDKKDQAKQGLDTSELSFEDYLIEKFNISKDALLNAKSTVSDTPAWSYDESEPVPKDVLRIIPQETARQYQVVPVEKKDNTLVVGMVDPTSLKSQQALRFILLRSDMEREIVVIAEQDFKEILTRYQELKGEVKSALEELEQGLSEGQERTPQQEELREETPITKITGVVLKHAIEGGASDIHIEPLRKNSRVRFRVDGVLYSSLMLPLAAHSSIVARVKILSSLRLDESRVPQDGRFNIEMNGRLIDFRVSTFPTNMGEKVVMRVLDPSSLLTEFKALGLTSRNRERVERAIHEPFGMILVSGPTGSGKTTTLYAGMNQIKDVAVNVVSLEDPVEYYMEGVNQSQVKPEIDYTFASGLRHVLRQDPDVLMVGEIRDRETARLAIQASLTGHMVLTTIHTNNAIGVLPRLIDLGVETFLVPSAVTLAMAQRLVGRLCEECKFEDDPSPRVKEIIEEDLAKVPDDVLDDMGIERPYKVWNAEGCPKCNNKRTKGRIAVYEVLEMTDELKQIVLTKEASAIDIEEEARRQGMITMRQDGIMKALKGIVSVEDVLRVVEE